MTLDETGTIMDILKAAYPSFAKAQSPDEKYQMALLWADLFADDDVTLVAMAVKALIAADEKGFPPHIGAVKEKIRFLTSPQELTELEAWNLVKKAMKCGHSTLPPILQKIVSGADLYNWRISDVNAEAAIQSNFMRSFRQIAQREREFGALPQSVKQFVLSAAGVKTMPMLADEQGGRGRGE